MTWRWAVSSLGCSGRPMTRRVDLLGDGGNPSCRVLPRRPSGLERQDDENLPVAIAHRSRRVHGETGDVEACVGVYRLRLRTETGPTLLDPRRTRYRTGNAERLVKPVVSVPRRLVQVAHNEVAIGRIGGVQNVPVNLDHVGRTDRGVAPHAPVRGRRSVGQADLRGHARDDLLPAVPHPKPTGGIIVAGT